MYFVLVKEKKMVICLLLVQLIAIEDKINTYPNVNFFCVYVIDPIYIKVPMTYSISLGKWF
jgi:hypothetical protein